MVDWTKATGNSGTMMIRDTGSVVEFWLRAGSSTFNHDLPWKYTVNGSTSSWREFDFVSGGDWQKLGGWTINYSQTVTFYLGDTGTSGLGGPTTFSHAIDRASPPSPPSKPVLSSITSTSMFVTFTDGANNGAGIDSRQITYGVSPNGGITNIASDGSTSIGGLTPGTVYYFWARTHNSEGWSGWSVRANATTLRVPDAPSAPVMSEITQVSAVATWTPNGTGGSAITGYDIGWGTSSTAPTTIQAATSPRTITGLDPGTNYYFWARAKNAIGTGPWSAPTMAHTIAGAWVKVGAVWKEAVPYVKVGGVWKVARPWVRVAGTWRETL
jgi:hypothetical protein